MRLTRLFLFMLVAATAVAVAAQEPIPISDLHTNDDQGVPLMLDQVVTIQGVVTAPTGVFNSARTEVFIQDDTGGMNLFTFSPVTTYELGDEVKVTGTVIAYNGFTEVEPITVELIGTGRPIPEPLVLTCAELRDSYDFATNTEPNESRLIRLNGVTWDSGNYALMDSTGTAMMYIDPDTGIPAPEGEFNVVGVMKQYDDAGEEGPWYLGYEVLPRFPTDITYGSGPQFVNTPKQTDVATGGATIAWTTDTACETVLEYGTTTNYEMAPIRLGNSTTTHEVVLTGLESATVYYVRAVAGNESESINSPAITIVSPAEQSSGQIDVYFSKSVDTSYSTGVDATTTDISQRMVALIDGAAESIDFCFFSFTLDDVADALVRAHQRGVDVRVIYENFDPVINVLITAGIPVVTDPDEEHENTHNKFAIFDARDGDETNDVVWTGSWNASWSGTHFNAENVVVVHDAALGAAYSIEFEEMWGGTFSNNKRDNTPHLFIIDGRRVEQYMSPSDDVPKALTDFIATAGTDLLFAIYGFTHAEITDAITDRIDAGVNVRGVFDAEGAAYEYSQYSVLQGEGADVVTDNVEQGDADDDLLHHKYLMTDPLVGGTDPAVVTGSYNWSYTAATYKDENILIIHDATITNIFFQEWMARYKEGGGTWEYEVPSNLEADFDWSPESPAAGQPVTFTDASVGDPTTWSWDFGDGSVTSTERNPTHFFTAAGTYAVTLEVGDGDATDTVSHDVIVVAGVSPTGTPVYVAAAGAAPGTGSVWATDVTVNNIGSGDLTYWVQFLERGKDNSDPLWVGPFTLGANESAAYPDVVTALFGLAKFGALSVVVSDPESAVVMSRTFNTYTNESLAGTFGQGLAGVAEADLIPAGRRVRLVHLFEDEDYRTNIGFLNGTGATVRVYARFYAGDGQQLGSRKQIDLPAYGNQQWNRAFGKVTSNDVSGGFVDVWTETEGGLFTTYASVAGEDAFSDPTTILPQEVSTTATAAAEGTPVYVAAAGSAPGVGSVWATDVTVNNAGSGELTYWMQFLERGKDNSDPQTVGPFTLGANESVLYTDVIATQFGLEKFGALVVIVSDPDSALVMSRTFNTYSSGGLSGTFGQSLPGVAEDDLIESGATKRLVHLSEDEDFRTNIGFLNATDASVRIKAEFFTADGTSLGTVEETVAAYGSIQWNRAFGKATSSDVTGGFVDVWTETEGGLFTTYASVAGEDAFSDPTTILPQ